MDSFEPDPLVGFKTRRREWYVRLRWWVSGKRTFEWFFLLFRERYVTRDSELVIEGYPRSGNTFARWAFTTAQKSPVQLSDHFHSIGHVRRALRLNIPVLILIREPVDAIVSFLVYQQGNYSVRQAFVEYIEFYRDILKNRDRLVVADFSEVIREFGPVIHRVNARFGTDFVLFDDTDDSRERCFKIMESRRTARKDPAGRRKFEIPRPVPERESLKQQFREVVLAPEYENLRECAQQIYRQVRG